MLRVRRALFVVSCLLALAPATASAATPEEIITGSSPSTNWFSGELFSQAGQNCSTAILGEPYTEIMVQGIAGFGGAPGGAVPTVNSPYWTVFTISIPGNPCGPGSSFVRTDLILPNTTVVDTARQIRCFGLPRSSPNWEDLTNQSWSLQGVGSGPYCVNGASPSIYQSNALSFGGRLIASGQLFKIFVPVRSSAPAVGITSSPPDGFYWLSNATGVYANPGLSRAYSAVFPAGSGGGPQVFFERPGAVPFWKPNPTPANTESRVELFANLYTAGQGGTFCPSLTRTDTSATVWSCNDFKVSGAWNDAIPAGGSLFKVSATGSALGPNGGYAPVGFDPPGTPSNPAGEWNVPMRATWTFDPAPAGPPLITGSADFRTLAGPDTDGDGVIDSADLCPATKGTLANGCLPAVVPDPDKDGIYGGQDLCPTQAGVGFSNGCPGGIVPAAQNPDPGPALPKALSGKLGLRKGAKLKRTALGKGVIVPVTCSRDAQAALTLQITKKTAKALRLKAKSAKVTIATGKGACTALRGGKLKLKASAAAAKALRRARRGFSASVVLRLTAADRGVSSASASVKVG